MSKSAVKRITTQLADEPREKLVEIIERQAAQIERVPKTPGVYSFDGEWWVRISSREGS